LVDHPCIESEEVRCFYTKFEFLTLNQEQLAAPIFSILDYPEDGTIYICTSVSWELAVSFFRVVDLPQNGC
jgi:hypothetical protein